MKNFKETIIGNMDVEVNNLLPKLVVVVLLVVMSATMAVSGTRVPSEEVPMQIKKEKTSTA